MRRLKLGKSIRNLGKTFPKLGPAFPSLGNDFLTLGKPFAKLENHRVTLGNHQRSLGNSSVQCRAGWLATERTGLRFSFVPVICCGSSDKPAVQDISWTFIQQLAANTSYGWHGTCLGCRGQVRVTTNNKHRIALKQKT